MHAAVNSAEAVENLIRANSWNSWPKKPPRIPRISQSPRPRCLTPTLNCTPSNPQPKNKSPRTDLSQVWISAFRLPCARSRLKPELRTSPQRRGGCPWERTHLACSVNRETVSTLEACAPRRTRIEFPSEPCHPVLHGRDARATMASWHGRPGHDTKRERFVNFVPTKWTSLA